jgi:hypothetical protein
VHMPSVQPAAAHRHTVLTHIHTTDPTCHCIALYHTATTPQVAQVEARVATSDEQGAYDVRFTDGSRAANLTALQLRAIDITVNPTAAASATAAGTVGVGGAAVRGSDASSGYDDSLSDVSGDVSGDVSLGKAQAAARKVRMKKFRYVKLFKHLFELFVFHAFWTLLVLRRTYTCTHMHSSSSNTKLH